MKNDWIITKRHLGIAVMSVGALGFIGLLVIDRIRSSDQFGPTQQLAVVACIGLILLGATLFPLGDRPA
jgi:hypothetical protein